MNGGWKTADDAFMPSRADLHLHSRFSDRSAEWLLRRFNFPDSTSEPKELYKALRAQGMQFITLTDHNRIDGCLSIADRPGVFVSEQVSTVFPEDRARVDLLVWNLTETQHVEMQELRGSVYELQGYLAEQGLLHAVAHPLYRLHDGFGTAHLEKLILLFRHFETLNGLRHATLGDSAAHILSRLTPEKIEELANRHQMAPTHEEPWRKVFTGGSDDHGGLYPGAAWTETPSCKRVEEFLDHIARGNCTPAGRGGSPIALSHGLYNTIYNFADERFLHTREGSGSLMHKMFSRFMEGRDPTVFSLGDKVEMLAQGLISGKLFELAKPKNASLWKQLSSAFGEQDFKQRLNRELQDCREPERRAFRMASLFVNQLGFRFSTRFIRQVSDGNFIDAIQEIGILGPIVLSVSPYVYAFRSQSPPISWLREASRSVAGDVPPFLENRKRAWFTDTLEDVNGVATTIRKMTTAAKETGADLVVVTCRLEEAPASDLPIRNFKPIGEFELPEYELQKLSFPPILEMIDYIEREQFTELIISTPGPVGATALLAAKLLGLRTVGIYHTDFPQYVRILTDDSFLETLTWKYMHTFYSHLDLVYVNSAAYRECWVQRGIAAEKIAILPRGLDLQLFHPCRRDRDFWHDRFPGRHAGEWPPVLIYVGRISKEKDLDLVVAAARNLREGEAEVVFVGAGPYEEELRAKLPQALFTGVLSGEELATAYASADLFLFPSTTDTFGNVVIEAHASGLPTIVSNSGGPKDLVEHGVNGLITRSLSRNDFSAAVRSLLDDPALRARMAVAARKGVEHRDWTSAFGAFWDGSPL